MVWIFLQLSVLQTRCSLIQLLWPVVDHTGDGETVDVENTVVGVGVVVEALAEAGIVVEARAEAAADAAAEALVANTATGNSLWVVFPKAIKYHIKQY